MINISGPGTGMLAGPPTPPYEGYSGPANPACFLTMNHLNDWGGQSLTTSQKYNFWRVELWIKKGPGAAIGDVDVELWAVDGNGHPTGTKLNSGVILNADIAEDYAWVSCTLDVLRKTPYIVSAATKYCVVVHGLDFTAVHYLEWACGGDGSGYPNGDQEWSTDGGNIWATDNTKDQLFRCYPSPFIDNYSGKILGGGSSMFNTENIWGGNSFTAQKSYPLKSLKMYFHKDVGNDVGNLIMALYSVDGLGHPLDVLRQGTIPDVDVPEGVPAWTGCDVADFNIVADTKYAVILRGPSLGPPVIRVVWDNWLGASDFPGGDYEYSNSGGVAWVTLTDKDFLFRCYNSF